MNAAALRLEKLECPHEAAEQLGVELSPRQLERCQAGDPFALRQFVLTYQQRIYAFIARMVSGAPVAEDLAQEVFLRAYKALPRFRQRPDARLSSWLYAIAHRTVLDHFRRQKRCEQAVAAPMAIDERTPEHHRRLSELQRLLFDALQQLPAEQRAVFVLVQFNQCSMREVAEALDVSLTCAKVRRPASYSSLTAGVQHSSTKSETNLDTP